MAVRATEQWLSRDVNGQSVGDTVLGLFAELIGGLPRAAAIRDGGDEFLIVGAPTDARLAGRRSGLSLRSIATLTIGGDLAVPVIVPVFPGGRI